jgi:hypothetical protein
MPGIWLNSVVDGSSRTLLCVSNFSGPGVPTLWAQPSRVSFQ